MLRGSAKQPDAPSSGPASTCSSPAAAPAIAARDMIANRGPAVALSHPGELRRLGGVERVPVYPCKRARRDCSIFGNSHAFSLFLLAACFTLSVSWVALTEHS